VAVISHRRSDTSLENRHSCQKMNRDRPPSVPLSFLALTSKVSPLQACCIFVTGPYSFFAVFWPNCPLHHAHDQPNFLHLSTMGKTKPRLSYYLRKSPSGNATIYAYIHYGTDRTKTAFSTEVAISPPKTGKYNTGAIQQMNIPKLLKAEKKIRKLAKQLHMADKPVTAQILKEAYLAGTVPCTTLKAYLEKWLAAQLARIGAQEGITETTYNKYEDMAYTIMQHLKETGQEGLFLSQVGVPFADRLKVWLGQRVGAAQKAKVVQLLVRVLKHAVMMEEIKQNKLQYYPIGRPKPRDPVYLNSEQVEVLWHHRFAGAGLDKARWLFLFQVYTGLSYIDTQEFDPGRHLVEHEGVLLIDQERFKTRGKSVLPYLPEAREIVERFGGAAPKLSLSKANKYLKECFAVAGIEVPGKVSTHLGRRTFANTMRAKGFSLEVVSRMVGHASTVTTETYYARSGAERLVMEMERLGRVMTITGKKKPTPFRGWEK